VRLRDLPSVDELARAVGDPLAVDAARAVLARAREEITAGFDPGDLVERLRAVHLEMVDAVLGGDGLGRVAERGGSSSVEPGATVRQPA
jgi:hypothetical protein